MAMFYPTEPNWIEEQLKNKWIQSRRTLFSFSFLDFLPLSIETEPFWMYFYYSQKCTEDSDLQRKIKFRAFVLEHSKTSYEKRSDVYSHPFDSGNPKIWFLCNQLEEIRKLDGNSLSDSDFEHFENKKLLSTIRNSIAPVRRLFPIQIINKTLIEYEE